MKRKVAIIDPLGAHGSSHHFYLFGQLDGLKNNNVDIRIYTNSNTEDPQIDRVKFYATFGDLFSSKIKIISGLRYILGIIRSVFHARFSGVEVFHFHIFYINSLVLFNILLVKLIFGKVTMTIHDVISFAKNDSSTLISNLAYKLTDLILTHNQFSKDEIIKIEPSLKESIHIIPHGNYTPFINIQRDKKKSREYLGLPADKRIILFFGMIKEVKGLDILLKSFKKVIIANPDTILVIAGKPWGNDFADYEELIHKNNLSK